jgi:hypothetical protein
MLSFSIGHKSNKCDRDKNETVFVLSCLMHRLSQHFNFNLLILVLSASLFQAAIADNSRAGSSETYCDFSQMFPGSAQGATHDRCTAGGVQHCVSAPACNPTANGFSLLAGNPFELVRLVVKAGHIRRSIPLYSIHATRLLRPPIA